MVSYKTQVKLSLNEKAEFNWWDNNIDSANAIPIDYGDPDIVIYSDASMSDWGAICNHERARGHWSYEQSSLQINELEMLAAFMALNSFAE